MYVLTEKEFQEFRTTIMNMCKWLGVIEGKKSAHDINQENLILIDFDQLQKGGANEK